MSSEEIQRLKETVHVLYEVTLLRSGWDLKNTNAFASRVEKVIRTNLGVSLDAAAKLDVKAAPEKPLEESDTGFSDGSKDEDADDGDSVPHMKVYPPAEDEEVLHDEL